MSTLFFKWKINFEEQKQTLSLTLILIKFPLIIHMNTVIHEWNFLLEMVDHDEHLSANELIHNIFGIWFIHGYFETATMNERLIYTTKRMLLLSISDMDVIAKFSTYLEIFYCNNITHWQYFNMKPNTIKNGYSRKLSGFKHKIECIFYSIAFLWFESFSLNAFEILKFV